MFQKCQGPFKPELSNLILKLKIQKITIQKCVFTQQSKVPPSGVTFLGGTFQART